MTLHLLPNLLHPEACPSQNFTLSLSDTVHSLDGFFVESEKEARKFLKHFDFDKLRDKPMKILDKNTIDFGELLLPLKRGEKWGVLTDAGLPCIADPGSKFVYEAKKLGIEIIAHVGPCSIILALMLSGIESQSFVFQGYIPRQLDREIRKITMTQVFIETPYNNHKSLARLLEVLDDNDLLCVAVDLTAPSQLVVTQTVREWKGKVEQYDFHKKPAIFLLKTAPSSKNSNHGERRISSR